MRTNQFPLKLISRIAKQVGIKRISKEALVELREIVNEKIALITRESIMLAKHAGRITIKEDDIKLAIRRLRK